VGNFPPLWSEWNGRYRDEVRDFWRGADNAVAEFAYRFTGSSDLYQTTGRTPSASINFVTCHDGFTLADLVSYNHKHNEANGENNRDGADDNRSWNCGVEGPTDDLQVRRRRIRQRRNFLVTLFLSQGVPMLLAGDELSHSQGGSNNAYAQDNATSWLDWEGADTEFTVFVRRLSRLRRQHPVFRRRRFFQGRTVVGENTDDINWFTPAGESMTDADWRVSFARSIAVFLNGDAIASPGPRGERITDDSFLVLFNAYDGDLDFTLPGEVYGREWLRLLDTALPAVDDAFPDERRQRPDRTAAGAVVRVTGRSVVLFRRATEDD
jgi:glycogen operon protein